MRPGLCLSANGDSKQMTVQRSETMEKWKLVDVFNGWEGKERYDTAEEAELALIADHEQWKKYNTGAKYMKGIVPAEFEWYYNGHEWIWG